MEEAKQSKPPENPVAGGRYIIPLSEQQEETAKGGMTVTPTCPTESEDERTRTEGICPEWEPDCSNRDPK